ncbi:MAG: phosphotransferase [Bacteroidia bacterium]
MLLTEVKLCHYLLQRGLLTSADFVKRKIEIRKNFSRNRNFLISVEGKAGFFVKQTSGSDYNKIRSIVNEANCYWLAKNDRQFFSLRKVMCNYFDYNPKQYVLILQLLKTTGDLEAVMARNNHLPGSIAREIAVLFSKLHTVRYGKIENKPADKLFNKSVPHIFKIDGTNEAFFNSVGNADRQILKIVNEKNGLVNQIKRISLKWNVECFIHGDIRLGNIITSKTANSKINLIDWELSDFGDPAWDTGCFMQSLLLHWVKEFKADEEKLPAIKEAAVLFMSEYINRMKINKESLKGLIVKVMEFAAIRLIQSSKELAYRQEELQPLQIKILQMCFNILSRPQKAAKDLLGISY